LFVGSLYKAQGNEDDVDPRIIGEICGFIGGTIGIAQGLPQVLRIRRLGHSNGVVLSPWILMCFMFAAWVGFGLKTASPAIWVTNALTFITTSMVVFAIRGKAISTVALLIAIAAGASMFVFYGPEILTNAVLVALTGSRIPQLIKTWLNRKTVQITAVSVPALTIAMASISFWMAYAILLGNPLVIATSCVAISVSLATAILESRIGQRVATQDQEILVGSSR
jgi:uncharacterized protein with PQ loop repeat